MKWQTFSSINIIGIQNIKENVDIYRPVYGVEFIL